MQAYRIDPTATAAEENKRPGNYDTLLFNLSEMRTLRLLAVATVVIIAQSLYVFPMSRVNVRLQKSSLQMSDYQSQVLAAQPTIEEWLDVAEPGLKKATLAMFRSVKEIAYKIRTASCDKMSCFNDYGTPS